MLDKEGRVHWGGYL